MKDFIGKGLTTNVNVINVLRTLLETSGNELYIPYDYVTTSKKGLDLRVHFAPKESGRPLQIMNIKGHSERFNVSITCLCDVKVEYVVDGKTELRDKKVWRSFNIIRDGELTICKLLAKLTKASYDEILQAGDLLYLGNTKLDSSFVYDEDAVYTIQLENIPLISYNWARPLALGYPEMQIRAQKIQEDLKVIRKYVKENMILTESKQEDSDIYTEEIPYSSPSKVGKEVKCVTYTIKEKSSPLDVKKINPKEVIEQKKKTRKRIGRVEI